MRYKYKKGNFLIVIEEAIPRERFLMFQPEKQQAVKNVQAMQIIERTDWRYDRKGPWYKVYDRVADRYYWFHEEYTARGCSDVYNNEEDPGTGKYDIRHQVNPYL